MTPYDAPRQPPTSPTTPPSPPDDEALLAAVVARGEGTPKSAGSGVLIVTVLLFVALGGLNWGWESVLFIAIAVALHELGHVIAMRIFGYKNVRMLFVPLFGGLATGEPRELDAGKNALVALAGPLFGLLTAGLAGAAAYALGSAPWLVEFAWVSLGLNILNLVPFVPLDGGQVANEALFSRYPVLELLFRLLAIAALGWLSWSSQAWLLLALVAFMLLVTPISYRRARVVRDARRDPSWQTRPLDREAVARLRELVPGLFPGVAPQKFAAALPVHVHGLWLGIRKVFPGPGKTVALLGAYLFTALIFAPGLAVFFARCLPKPAF